MVTLKGKISEIFKSIQGEGIYQGFEQVFVRFFGCNLHCSFCDTKLNFYQEKSVFELGMDIEAYDNYHSISLTGGEPLLQVDFLAKLTENLKKEGKVVYLETNGTLYQNLKRVINNIDIIAMDFKFPSSTDLGDFWSQHREFLKVAQEKEVFIKAVITKTTHRADLQIALAIIREVKRDLVFVLQPEHPFENELKEKLDYFQKICKNSMTNTKVIPQLHKALDIR